MSKIWFVRHAESTSNAGGVTQDNQSIPLTEKGKRQALELRTLFKNKEVDLFVSSPYVRAQETARPVLMSYSSALAIETWPIQEFSYLSGEKYKNTSSYDRKDAVNDFWNELNPFYRDGDDAESFIDLMVRAQSILERVGDYNLDMVLFSHGQFMKMIWWLIISGWRDIGPASMMKKYWKFVNSVAIPNTGILELDLDNQWAIKFKVDHIKEFSF